VEEGDEAEPREREGSGKSRKYTKSSSPVWELGQQVFGFVSGLREDMGWTT
jgi:hypothetical protein